MQVFVLILFSLGVQAYFYEPGTVSPLASSGFDSGIPLVSKSTWNPANGTVLCFDPTTDSTWMFLSDETLLLVSSTAQTIFQINATLSGPYPMAICDIKSHTILYYDQKEGNLVSFCYLGNGTQNYKVPMNPMTGQWTGNSSNFTRLFAVSSSLNIQSYNVSTGVLLETSSTISSKEIYYVEDGIAVLFNGSVTLFDEENLNIRCTIQEDVLQIFTNEKNLFLATTSEINCYDSHCNFLWRVPLQPWFSPNAEIIFSFDLSGNVYFYQSERYDLLGIDNQGHKFVFESPRSNATIGGYSYPYGVDNQGYLYFVWYCDSESECDYGYQESIFFYKYSPTTSETICSQTIGGSYSPGAEISAIGLTSQGTIFQFHDSAIYVFTAQEAKRNPFIIMSNLSLVVLSFVVVIALSLKHCCCGEDPKGWNKWKIPEVASCIILTTVIVIVSMLTIYTQFQLNEEVQNNTAYFDSLQGFYNSYLEPCGNGTVATPLELCTCSGGLDTNPCISGACANATSYYCTQLYQQTCDCANSFYQYSCNCTYLEGEECSAVVTNSTNPNVNVQNAWDSCQTAYYYPTSILWLGFGLSVFSSFVIVVLNIVQCGLKFDNGKVDLLLSVLSIVSSVTILTIAIVGSNLLQNGESCLLPFMETIPGCVLNSAGSGLPSQETTAQYSLASAYQNLLTSPFVVIVCAIPDIISLFSCVLPKRRRTEEMSLINEAEGENEEINWKDTKCIKCLLSCRYKTCKRVMSWIMKITCCCFCFSSIVTLLFLLYYGII